MEPFFSYTMEDSESGFDALFCRPENISRAENYFSEQRELEAFQAHYQTGTAIALLKNMWVEEEERGQGIGSELLSEFLSKTEEYGLKAVYLIADTGEDNDFNIVSWYESNGFSKLTPKEEFPLMCKAMT